MSKLSVQIAEHRIAPKSLGTEQEPTRQDMRAALREITAPAHQRLHHHAGLTALLHGKLTRLGYIQLLQRMFELHETIERRLAVHEESQWLKWYTGPPRVSRAANIRNDWAKLGLPASQIETIPIPDAVLPHLENAAAALGCAWVVEGSAQGGRILGHQAEAIWPGAATFFTPSSDQNERWQSCRAAVDQCGDDPGRRAALLAGAAATFAAYEAWLCGTP